MCAYMRTFWGVGVHMSKCVCVCVCVCVCAPYAVHFIMCTVCVYSNPSLSHCSYITTDTDNTIFMFNVEVSTVVFVLASYHKSFHQTVCCPVLALLLCVQDIPGFKFIQDTQYSGCDSFFSASWRKLLRKHDSTLQQARSTSF